MATKDDVGVWYLNADGSDAIKDFPTIQRANAEKLTATRAPSIAGFSLDKSLKNATASQYMIGKTGTLTVEFKTPQFTTAPEVFRDRILYGYRPRYAVPFMLTGITDLLEPTVTAFIIDPDGYIKRNPKTPLSADTYYAGTVVWLAS